jgi:NitT/TauT family transport system substrate-binding protein
MPKMLRVAVPDMVSNSFFPVLAAVDLGFFHDEGVDAMLELLPPPSKSFAALREGELDFVAGSAHDTLSAFPGWRGAKLLAAVRQHVSWLLVVRTELGAARGDLNVVKGLRIGAAPGPDAVLKRILLTAGIEPDRDGVQIVSMSEAADSPPVSFGVAAAQALAEGRLDGIWVNGLAAASALQRGIGTLLLDVRRGDGPSDARDYTFTSLVTTDHFLAERSREAEAVVRALVSAQRALQEDPGRATEVGLRRFPRFEAELIADVVRLDAPYYDAAISERTVTILNQFLQDTGRLHHAVSYAQVVATQMRPLWHRSSATL